MENRQFETALHILVAMGYHPETRLKSEDIAKSVNTNPVVIRRLLSQLSAADLIVTVKGKGGGVQLSRSPQAIDLREIYLAVGGPQLITPSAKRIYKNCPVSVKMGHILAKIAEGAQKEFLRSLSRIKLAQLVASI